MVDNGGDDAIVRVALHRDTIGFGGAGVDGGSRGDRTGLAR